MTQPFIERRTGPADRRQGQRGGRRSTDIVATTLVAGTIFVAGCAKGERLNPIAPAGLLDSEARAEISAPASPRSTIVSPVVADEGESESDADIEVADDPGSDEESEIDGETDVVELSDFEVNAAVAAGSFVVQPGSATVTAGKTKQYVVKGAKGTVRWRATGGTITSNGLFKAGSTAGTFSVTATTTRQGSKKAKVTVKRPATTPPPGDTGGGDTGGGGTGGGGTGGGSGGGGTIQTDGTVISVGQSIQSAVNANPEGTTFIIKAGVHRRQSVKPKSGMKFVGEPGAVLDGEGATPRAFAGSNINNVTIRGLRITNYAPPNIGGAIDAIDTTGWVVEDNEIDHNSNGSNRTYGVHLGSSMIVRDNKIHHNGWNGISGYKAVGTTIEGNEIYANPPAAFNDTIGEAANMKCYDCGGITVRNNNVHDGPHVGIWFDRSRPGITIANNRVVNHGQAGIWYEVSYRGTIRDNHVENAGTNSYYSSGWLRGGGIQVTNSPDVSVISNTVVNSLNGIIGLQASSYYNGPYGASELRNLLVQNNTIIMSKGQTGIAENINNKAVFDGWNNRFTGNRYQLGAIAKPFYWKGMSLSADEWKAGAGASENW